MVLQLAWFRLHKKITPVYESSSTRGFFEARTETGRSLSSESKAFVESFDNDHVLVYIAMINCIV
jgi:carnitine O-acetyltransferase